jgi:chemotaxis protein histidine kinase CheA
VMEEILIALGSGRRPGALGTVFRLAHTLKGNGASRVRRPRRFCHTLEDLLDRCVSAACP